jgi:putative hydrolase of the HAD superfamily
VIRAALFDLDGTLLDRRRTFGFYLEDQVVRQPALIDPAIAGAYVRRMLELDENGYALRDVVFQRVEDELALPAGAWRLLLDDWESHFPVRCVPLPGVPDALERLRERGVRLALITNGRERIQRRKIDGLGIAPLFDQILVSETEGVRKPSSEIFSRALTRLGVEPGESLFVGDDPECDVRGARACGMLAVWKRDPGWPEPAEAHATVADVGELPDLLERLEASAGGRG